MSAEKKDAMPVVESELQTVEKVETQQVSGQGPCCETYGHSHCPPTLMPQHDFVLAAMRGALSAVEAHMGPSVEGNVVLAEGRFEHRRNQSEVKGSPRRDRWSCWPPRS